ncbi:hypothetical protein BDZ97DRAFT_1756857 [Flammula alnicola]|nr:hypothetical protein BDZ97DRAFT_1756857 [Flammula alnicola]
MPPTISVYDLEAVFPAGYGSIVMLRYTSSEAEIREFASISPLTLKVGRFWGVNDVSSYRNFKDSFQCRDINRNGSTITARSRGGVQLGEAELNWRSIHILKAAAEMNTSLGRKLGRLRKRWHMAQQFVFCRGKHTRDRDIFELNVNVSTSAPGLNSRIQQTQDRVNCALHAYEPWVDDFERISVTAKSRIPPKPVWPANPYATYNLESCQWTCNADLGGASVNINRAATRSHQLPAHDLLGIIVKVSSTHTIV